ncbi:HD-GYP domain-containing protein [Candidatus Neomarinimicrobiota bacterium]
MIKKVKSKELKVGMYVKLGASWLTHSFLKPNFIITSDKQIKQIIKNGIREVNVDFERSRLREERDILKDLGMEDRLKKEDGKSASAKVAPDGIGRKQGDFEKPEEFNPIAAINLEFRQTIENTNIPPKNKAKAVYTYSIQMMNTVLEEPTGSNILHGKKLIADTVDFILSDDDTSSYLSRITSHDYYTYTHSVNVGMLGVLLAKEAFGGTMSSHNMRELGAGFFLHDLGKCDVPLTLINKPDILSPEEWKVMRDHPSRGSRLLSKNNALSKETGIVVMQHHERIDGSGYPFGLRGDEIHVYGRICTISDVYDALTSTRAYKKNMSPLNALKVMKEEMVNHFNRDLFNVFVTLFSNSK